MTPPPLKVRRRRKGKEVKERGTGVDRGGRKGRAWGRILAESSRVQSKTGTPWVESLDLSYQEYLQVAICSELGRT